ncbi:WXG100 family type VII secretion target [uncultured Corynebacterium sp.]|uniref:WXG100 family type VII secretion target n=1 Tax=uncultured Corynebacterium sp. TaxID=159447 RepID=UPI0025EE2F81|nr:WXG100 family type VII secretion target [uncultured Corynebacterium sp.]
MIKYDFAQIAQASADIRATCRNINGMLDQLKGDIAPMVAEWEGTSAAAYRDAQRRWDSSAEELSMVLDSVARTVDDSNARMSQINTSAANSWP